MSETKIRQRGKHNSYEKGDEIWLIFDCDEHDGVINVINTAKQAKIGVAYSNPCFEIWGVIHYQDHDAPVHRHAAQKLLKNLMPCYNPSGAKSLDVEHMLDNFEQAASRAKLMRRRRIEEGQHLGCPYTDVDLLVEKIASNGRA